MALFSRREIQKRLDEVAALLTREQLTTLTDRLNRTDQRAIEAEWELMCLSSLARTGTVRHEHQFPGATRFPDVHFKNAAIEFIADITAVSDAGYEDENPVDILWKEMRRLIQKHAPLGGLDLAVQSGMHGKPRDQKVKLAIPPQTEIPAFLKRNFVPFLQMVGKNPDTPARHQAPVEGAGVIQLDYNPKRRPQNRHAGHLSFDVPYSLKRNPVFNSLKAKKQQLAKAGFSGLTGIVLCDGDCSALTSRMYNPTAYTLDNIVWDFLRQNSSIGFVIAVGVASQHSPFGGRTQHSLVPKLFTQRSVDATATQCLTDVYNAMLGHFPKVHRTPSNARYHIERGSPPTARRSDFFCWFSVKPGGPMQKSEIKLSSRTLTALLAGAIDLKEFREAHCLSSNNGSPPFEPLRQFVHEGRKLESVKIEEMPGEDDDLVVLTFGPVDMAAVKFQMPDKV